MKFEDLGLAPEILKAVAETGYTEPTPIQAEAIPHVLAGRDVLGIAQTGTGKTAGFTLPMIDKLSRGRARARMPRSLILEPTRELAAQVAENFETYGKYNKLSMALLIGGVSFGDQEKKLDRGVDVLIATPGRLLDHCGRGKVLLTGVQILVIDEADRMLDMGFIPDIEEICKKLPFTRQTLFFSATMPPEIQRLTDTFLHNPARIEVARAASSGAGIKQVLVKTTRDNKRDLLQKIIEDDKVKNAIVFCNRKRDVASLERVLTKNGLSAGAIHGDLDQSTRTKTLDGFRKGTIRILVASDVAARGLDIPDVSHVFNYDVPSHAEDYVHRMGRTGSAGKTGTAFTLATREDGKYLAAIEKLIGHPIPEGDGAAAEKTDEPAEVKSKSGPKDEQNTEAKAEAETGGEEQPKEAKKPSRGRRGGRGRKKEPEDAASGTDEKPSEDARIEAKPATPQKHEEKRTEAKREEKREEKPAHRERGGRGHDKDDARPVIGLGDHVPAFLLREFKLPKRRASDDDDAETAADEKETEEA
ncbi:MAG: DEAD/DEAH box helicase [Parvibaculum sp.]|nr:DEAD/DEAH box helicase [Parvibaculum sp.]